MKAFNTTRSLLLACSIALLVGCGGSSSADSGVTTGVVSAPTGTDTTATTVTSTTSTATSSTGIAAGTAILLPLTVAETDTLLFVREEEKMARDVYLTLYSKWGQLIFQNIATRSEQQHMDTMKLLIDSLGLVDPVVSDAVVISPTPRLTACMTSLWHVVSFPTLKHWRPGHSSKSSTSTTCRKRLTKPWMALTSWRSFRHTPT